MCMHFCQKIIIAFWFVTVAACMTFCQYKEGIDTTDANGYARDSLFGIDKNYVVPESGSKIVIYYYDDGRTGFFTHAFEDIQKTPDILDTLTESTYGWFNWFMMNRCYAIQKGKNLYAKICVLQKLTDGKYVYRYARNNINQLAPQGDSMLKPNNVFIIDTSSHDCTHITWEPPLTKAKQLKGYIYYISKHTGIDTLEPINMEQWDSVAFTSTTSLCASVFNCYINLAAVYKDGTRSEFLKGWTHISNEWADEVVAPSMAPHSHPTYPHLVTLRKTSNGYRVDLSGLSYSNLPESIVFYSLSGRQIARIDGIKDCQPSLPVPYSQGVSLFKMVFPDNHVVSGRCIVARQ